MTDRQTDKQTDRQSERETDRQTDKDSPLTSDHLDSLVVNESVSNVGDSGFKSRPSHTKRKTNGNNVAALPDTWRYGVSSRTGRPNVSTL